MSKLTSLAFRSLLLGLLLLSIAGCGGSGQDTPTSVSADDLGKTGEFWLKLTPDLKDELVNHGKEKLGEVRPDGATAILAVNTEELVNEIDKQYANKSKSADTVYDTYIGANDALAQADLNGALDQLDQLCDGVPAPPQCDQP